jgi:hypothetical protein
MGAEFGKVFRCWVAFMLGKSILRVEPVALEHHAVALDFGNDAGCRDAEAYAITADQRGLRAWKTRDGKAIDEGVGGPGRKLFDHCAHSGVRCTEDIEAVNFLRGDGDGSPPDVRICRDLSIESFARFGGEFFGVIEPTQNKVRREDDCTYDDRASEWPTTRLINACDRFEAQCEEAMLMNERARHGISLKEHRHQCRSGTMPMKLRRIRSWVAQTLENTPGTGVPPSLSLRRGL